MQQTTGTPGGHAARAGSIRDLSSFKQNAQKLSLGCFFLMPYKAISDHSQPGLFVVTDFNALPASAPLVDVVDESLPDEILKQNPQTVRWPLFTRVSETAIDVNVFETKRAGAPQQEVRQTRRFLAEQPFRISVGDVIRVGIANKGTGMPGRIGVPCVVGNFYLSVTGGTSAKAPSVFPSASDVVQIMLDKEGGGALPERLIQTLLKYELQHLPRLADFNTLAQLDAQPLTPLPQPIDHQYRRPPATLLSINGWLNGDMVDGDPFTDLRYVLPDAAWCHTAKTARGGLLIGLTARKLAVKFGPAGQGSTTEVPSLDGSISCSILDYARFGEAPYRTGINNLRKFESADVFMGIYFWPLTAAVMMPHASTGRPPVPMFVLFETDFIKSAADLLNSPSGAGQRKAAEVDQVLMGTNVIEIPRIAEYTRRYGVPVSRAWVKRRFADLRLGSHEQKDMAMTAENDGYTWDNYKRKVFLEGRGFVRADNLLNEETFDTEPTVVFVDGHPGRVDQFLSDANLAYDFYALCTAAELSAEQLTLPVKEDPTMVGRIKEEQAPLMCALASVEAGEAYVRSVLEHFLVKRTALAKKYGGKLTDDALADAVVHMQEAREHPMKDPGIKAKKSRLPIFTYVGIRKDYVPIDPAAIRQPSAVDGVSEPAPSALKREREDSVESENKSVDGPEAKAVRAAEPVSEEAPDRASDPEAQPEEDA